MKNAADTPKFEKLIPKNDEPYFNLRAGNMQVIGKSEMYESDKACINRIASVKKNAPAAKTEG